MKLYVAERHYDYEGFQILGVYSTKSLAESACDKDVRPAGDYMGGQPRGDGHSVEEFTLDVTTV